MVHDLDIRIEALRRLPAGDAVWQLGMTSIPAWVENEGIPPYRPRLVLCRCDVTGLVGASRMLRPGDPLDQAALDALASLGRMPGVEERPARVDLDSRELHEALAPVLAGLDVETALLGHLDSLDEPMESLRRQMGGPRIHEGCFTSDEVTVERLRAYADAAAEFYRARPWRHLTSDDLVVVESPVPTGMSSCFVVLGNAGHEFGLGFYKDASAFERIQRAADEGRIAGRGMTWLQGFDSPHRLPIADTDLWALHALPVAWDHAHPLLIENGHARLVRPVSPVHLTFMEGLMRAVTASSEDDIDSGRWTRSVTTFEGEVEVALAIPALLVDVAKTARSHDPRRHESVMRDLQRLMAQQDFKDIDEANAFLQKQVGKRVERLPATTPAEQAQDLIADAFAAVGRQRARLARQALAVWPDCADAYVIRAEEMPDANESLALYREAVQAGARAIGVRRFGEMVGHFWGVLETRPYMRARAGLAHALWENDEQEEALEHWADLLRLDPDDHLGVRYPFIAALLEMRRTGAALDILDRYHDEPSTLLAYARALAVFQLEGDDELSRSELAGAILRNPHVTKYLVDPKRIPLDIPDTYVARGEDEAIVVADELEAAWSETPGATAWLKNARREKKRVRKQAAAPRGGGAKPPRRRR